MSAVVSIMDKFWKIVKIGDDKLHAAQTEPAGIKRIYDIPYINDGNRFHLLDVYYPENLEGKAPVIIDVHGGGWMYAEKELNRIYCLNLAKRGYVVFNMSYRLIPDVTVNEQIRDVMHALKWISVHMNEYPCDTDKIMLTGDSAGGMLAAFTACLVGNKQLCSVFDTVTVDMKLTALALTSPVAYMYDAGIMSVYTRTMWGKNYKSKKTFSYMDIISLLDGSELPPTFMVTSSGDILGLKQTRRAAADFRAKGIDTGLLDFPKFNGKDLPHVFSVLEPESEAGVIAIEAMLDFFKKYM